MLQVGGSWHRIGEPLNGDLLAQRLPEWLLTCRWFAGKARPIRGVEIVDAVPLELHNEAADYLMLILQVDYVIGLPETYVLPVGFVSGECADRLIAEQSVVAITAMEVIHEEEIVSGVLYDACSDEELGQVWLELIAQRRTAVGVTGQLTGEPLAVFPELRGLPEKRLAARGLRTEQSNSTLIFGDRLLLKLYRKLASGTNPDLEVGRFLSEVARFAQTPRIAGVVEYRHPSGESSTVGMLQAFVPNQGDAWNFTLGYVRRFFDRVRASGVVGVPSPQLVENYSQDFLRSVSLLGQRTAEMHLALASVPDDPVFAPEPLTDSDQRLTSCGLLTAARQVWQLLGSKRPDLPVTAQAAAQTLLAKETELSDCIQKLTNQPGVGRRIRCHGDYHLGQVLCTDGDFLIIDFEGEPARPLAERRLKQAPLRDVAGMIRSFDYAVQTVLLNELAGRVPEDDFPKDERWAELWSQHISRQFLAAYLGRVQQADDPTLIPQTNSGIEAQLNLFLLEKAVYELAYELNNRPTWVPVPLRGLLRILSGRF